MKNIIQLIRPKHWLKNGFVLAPLFFSFQFINLTKFYLAILAVASFSMAASSIYVINDILDRNYDVNHPSKRFRPIASGRVSLMSGVTIALLSATISLFLASLINAKSIMIVLIYIVINFLYSVYLKNIVIIDVFTIASGFVLRVVMGAIAINVVISEWILLTTIFLSLFLGFSKRYYELGLDNHKEHRAVLGSYSKSLVLLYMSISAVLTIVIYTFYTIDPSVVSRFHAPRLLYSIPIVVFGLFRYLQLVVQEQLGGDVSEVVLKDKYIILSVILWMGLVIWAYQW